jgi:hypothetical protein
MSNEQGLGKMPEALKTRVRDVELSDGSTIRVEKWSWLKFRDLLPKVDGAGHAMEIAEKSVREADRARLANLDPEDVLAVAKAAIDLNMTPGLLKNLGSLVQAGQGLLEAVTEKAAQ